MRVVKLIKERILSWDWSQDRPYIVNNSKQEETHANLSAGRYRLLYYPAVRRKPLSSRWQSSQPETAVPRPVRNLHTLDWTTCSSTGLFGYSSLSQRSLFPYKSKFLQICMWHTIVSIFQIQFPWLFLNQLSYAGKITDYIIKVGRVELL